MCRSFATVVPWVQQALGQGHSVLGLSIFRVHCSCSQFDQWSVLYSIDLAGYLT